MWESQCSNGSAQNQMAAELSYSVVHIGDPSESQWMVKILFGDLGITITYFRIVMLLLLQYSYECFFVSLPLFLFLLSLYIVYSVVKCHPGRMGYKTNTGYYQPVEAKGFSSPWKPFHPETNAYPGSNHLQGFFTIRKQIILLAYVANLRYPGFRNKNSWVSIDYSF